MSPRQGRIVVISGPSGVGKSTVVERLLTGDEFVKSVSATTRAPRRGEEDGVHYHFLAREEFLRRVEAGAFLEWAEVHGQLYGTLARPVTAALAAGKYVFLDIDVQGQAILREKLPLVSVFLKPPALAELRRRLEERGDTAPEVIEKRLQAAEEELGRAFYYDLQLVNEDLEQTVAEIRAYLAGLEEE